MTVNALEKTWQIQERNTPNVVKKHTRWSHFARKPPVFGNNPVAEILDQAMNFVSWHLFFPERRTAL